jgi:hypothetical protein
LYFNPRVKPTQNKMVPGIEKAFLGYYSEDFGFSKKAMDGSSSLNETYGYQT